jgi:deazaflavin-dependent oxidoreductase (nitroreductase family)
MQPKPGWRRWLYGLLATPLGSWLFAWALPPIDRAVFRISGGRQTAVSALAGLPSIILSTTGAPLVAIPDGKRFILIASNFGGRHHPGWYYNLCAHPQAAVSLNGETGDYTAREASGPERERCWAMAVEYYRGYEAYRKRTERDIHVMILEPA